MIKQNIGGYNPNSMQEKHEFGLVVASSSSEAKNKAKSKWLIDYKKKFIFLNFIKLIFYF